MNLIDLINKEIIEENYKNINDFYRNQLKYDIQYLRKV